LDVDPVISVLRGEERDQNWAGSEAEAIHRNRYLPAERLYIDEVDPKPLVDLVIDNAVFGQPRIVRT
jgi:uridine kinase